MHIRSEIINVAGWNTTSCASACNTDTTPTQPHRNSNTHRTKNNTTNVVIQQNSRKLLMMDILMSETCWAHKKWNKIANDIKLDFYSSIITMMHGPINIRSTVLRPSGFYHEDAVSRLVRNVHTDKKIANCRNTVDWNINIHRKYNLKSHKTKPAAAAVHRVEGKEV